MSTATEANEQISVPDNKPKRAPVMPRYGLSAPRTARGQFWITAKLRTFRRSIEVELSAIYGENASGLIYAALVQSALRHEWAASSAAHRLAQLGSEPPVKELAMLTGIVQRATDARDKVLARLGITTPATALSNPWDDALKTVDCQSVESSEDANE